MRLLFAHETHIVEIETLYILDFYLLFPALLRDMKMPEDVRAKFRTLEIEKYHDQFVQVPSPQSLYRDLAVIQRTSLVGLAAKTLIDPTAFQSGNAKLNIDHIPEALTKRIEDANKVDADLLDFLIHDIGEIDLSGPRGLRNSTQLVRRI